ncbi:hypothetical protein BN871_FV_00040 [Paenibacillus sp. P22]|nr:hypothetical protein BN871_FV_00040 [Paenibacillus sp. P22]
MILHGIKAAFISGGVNACLQNKNGHISGMNILFFPLAFCIAIF